MAEQPCRRCHDRGVNVGWRCAGPENRRAIISFVRTLYGDAQKFRFVGPRSDGVFVEDYAAAVDGMPLAGVVTTTKNESGQTQHIVASYRPRSSVLHFSQLLGEKFADTAYGDQFASGEKVRP